MTEAKEMNNRASVTNSQLLWTVISVNEFARLKGIDLLPAFTYLHTYGGIAYLMEHYEAEHMLSFDDVMEDLDAICKEAGGTL